MYEVFLLPIETIRYLWFYPEQGDARYIPNTGTYLVPVPRIFAIDWQPFSA
jgi:hypothetical protein